MRIYLRLTKNTKLVPFNYQELLTGTIHKWIGRNNEIHGVPNRYSFSWIQNTRANKNGLNLLNGAHFFISSNDEFLIKRIIKSILDDPEMFNGISVYDVLIKETPNFNATESFLMASPVLLKERDGDKTRHVTLKDPDFEQVLTENLKRKLEWSGINPTGVAVKLNPETFFRQTKLVTYKGVKNRVSFAPIIIEGDPEQIAFAWNQGLGNSTGIGFGALK